MAPKRSARKTAKRVQPDFINDDDFEDEASSEAEAPPKKRRQTGRPGKPSKRATSAQPDQKSKDPLPAGQAKHSKGKAQAESASVAAAQAANPTTPAKPGSVKSLSLPGTLSAVDAYCSLAGTAQVVPGHDVMLNQTNIGKNNNKFYRLQWLRQPGEEYVWTRWGRVGDKGQSKLLGPFAPDKAEKEFRSKFRQKSGVAWEDQELARSADRPGKYCLVDVEASTPAKSVQIKSKSPGQQQYMPCQLPTATQQLMDLIFEEKMFTDVMEGFELDMVRMPLGQLSTAQVQRGYEVLGRVRDALAGLSSDSLVTLSNEFYTTIPHNFKRSRPPVIDTEKALELKFRMLDVLSDIEVAQDLLDQAKDEGKASAAQLLLHPADEKCGTLKADLQVMERSEQDNQVVEQYVKATSSNLQLLNLWSVERQGEGKAFEAHAHLDNRRLLWHGTNIATVAAILKAGLRIMPHASGRVGRGLYLASENSKSACYVRCGTQGGSYVGVMFLAETALGREHHIVRDDPSLTQPPSGFDSVVAKGVRAPDPSRDKVLELEARPVTVPVGPIVPAQQFAHSSFLQDEYLVYKESQARIRYMLTLKFTQAGHWH